MPNPMTYASIDPYRFYAPKEIWDVLGDMPDLEKKIEEYKGFFTKDGRENVLGISLLTMTGLHVADTKLLARAFNIGNPIALRKAHGALAHVISPEDPTLISGDYTKAYVYLLKYFSGKTTHRNAEARRYVALNLPYLLTIDRLKHTLLQREVSSEFRDFRDQLRTFDWNNHQHAPEYETYLPLRNELIAKNLGLVGKAVTRIGFVHRFNEDESQDVFQEATLGLLRAIELHNLCIGVNLSTYSLHWIAQVAFRTLPRRGVITLPSRAFEQRDYDPQIRSVLSLDDDRHPGEDGENLLSYDLIRDPQSPDETELVALLTRKQLLERVVDELNFIPSGSANMGDVLGLRYGDEELTLQEIGEKFDLTRVRIRQLERQALERLPKLGLREEDWI